MFKLRWLVGDTGARLQVFRDDVSTFGGKYTDVPAENSAGEPVDLRIAVHQAIVKRTETSKVGDVEHTVTTEFSSAQPEDTGAGLFGRLDPFGGAVKVESIIWRDVRAELPEPKKIVMLVGMTGYSTPSDQFLINGVHNPNFERFPWRDANGDELESRGWTPQFWADMISLPKPLPDEQ